MGRSSRCITQRTVGDVTESRLLTTLFLSCPHHVDWEDGSVDGSVVVIVGIGSNDMSIMD